jgi:hypothetical protein
VILIPLVWAAAFHQKCLTLQGATIWGLDHRTKSCGLGQEILDLCSDLTLQGAGS